jgi:hypothetical protein
MVDCLMLALLVTAFVGTLGYVKACPVLVDQGDPHPDKTL